MTKQTCIIYVRVSTEEQKKKVIALLDKFKECTAYAQRMGYQIGNIFADEGRVLKTLNVPNCKRMLKYIKQNGKNIGAVIFFGSGTDSLVVRQVIMLN